MRDYYFDHEGLPFSLMIQGASHVLLDYKNPEVIKALSDPNDQRIRTLFQWVFENNKAIEATSSVDDDRWHNSRNTRGYPSPGTNTEQYLEIAISERQLVINSPVALALKGSEWIDLCGEELSSLQCQLQEATSIEAKTRQIRLEMAQKYDSFKRKLKKRDGSKCKWCGDTNRIEVDHIFPVSRGGGNSLENLQLLCRACNAKKRAKIPE
jgi:hypothetical protein